MGGKHVLMSDINTLYLICISEWYCRSSSCNFIKHEQGRYMRYFRGSAYISI